MSDGYTYNVSMFRETFETQYTYLNGFLRNVARFGDAPALHDPQSGRRWTYRQLNAQVNQLAHAMRQDGVGKNDVVMFALLNSPEFIFCYLAAHKVGAIACPVNYRQGAGEIALVIDDSRPKVFVYDAQFGTLSQDALALAEHKPDRVLVAGGQGAESFDGYMDGQPETDPPIDFHPHIYDETTRLYTSGTTNRPKGVPINNINEVLSAHDVIMHFPLTPTDRTMNMTPWFHRGGIHSGGPCPTLYIGGEVVILRDFHPRTCLEYAERYGVTFLIGVPTILAMLARAQERTPVDLSALRGIVTMGAPFEKAACEKYMKLLTPNIFNGYGTTETFWNTFLRPYDLPEMSGSAGRACTDDDVRVVAVHPDGSHAEPEEVVPHDSETPGEIIIRSPAKSAFCYYNNPEMTAQKFYKGWLYTGDMGTWDKNEFVTICGRKDDMIVSAGENIYPTQIEAVLNEHPKVAESAVIGIPDRLRGEVVAAYIVPSDDSLTVEEIKAYCVQSPMLSSYKWPRSYTLVKELPHTATGKLMHYKLRQQVLEKE
ncbi:class I adenylate-forming enzyme family protein [Butyricicoccus pullicaecorum]|uniref:class I adenylate-forming enzyme family protein n=1 Tax=Butyricicoccus pullicaecorum TaxID=501571 RepID=UPI0039909413